MCFNLKVIFIVMYTYFDLYCLVNILYVCISIYDSYIYIMYIGTYIEQPLEILVAYVVFYKDCNEFPTI